MISANNVIIFGFFPDQTTEKAKSFLSVAQQVDDQVFAIVSSEEVVKELEAQADDLVLYKNVSILIIHIFCASFLLLGKLHIYTSYYFTLKTEQL